MADKLGLNAVVKIYDIDENGMFIEQVVKLYDD
jgi:hypothetical protein